MATGGMHIAHSLHTVIAALHHSLPTKLAMKNMYLDAVGEPQGSPRRASNRGAQWQYLLNAGHHVCNMHNYLHGLSVVSMQPGPACHASACACVCCMGVWLHMRAVTCGQHAVNQ